MYLTYKYLLQKRYVTLAAPGQLIETTSCRLHILQTTLIVSVSMKLNTGGI